MYIPRNLFHEAYNHLKSYAHSTNPSVLLLCALDTDSICATRIFTHLLKRDFIPHNLHPIAGYRDLENVNRQLVKDNEGLKFVICIGLGGLIDLSEFLGWGDEGDEAMGMDKPEIWVIDSRRPWNLSNVFSGGGIVKGGRHKVGQFGGVKVWDDGDIELELESEGEAYKRLEEMPEVEDGDSESDEDYDEQDDDEIEEGDTLRLGDGSDEETTSNQKKRKSSDLVDDSDEESTEAGARRRRRRRMADEDDDSLSPTPGTPTLPRRGLLSVNSRSMRSSPPIDGFDVSSPGSEAHLPPARMPSQAKLRRKLRKMRQKHQQTIAKYYSLGTWYGEPCSGIMYSLASDLGREDNDLLWLAIVGVTSNELYGRKVTSTKDATTSRELALIGLLRDEVRRLNPPSLLPDSGSAASQTTSTSSSTSLDTIARGPNDKSIRLSPEFRFMMIRHWSLYESMLHSSYLVTRLSLFKETGIKKLHKLLAKMGVSLAQCKQTYTHMDMDLKRSLREKITSVSRLYGLDDLVRDGFVRSWGWKAVLSAGDVGTIISGILEIGKDGRAIKRGIPTPNVLGGAVEIDSNGDQLAKDEEEEWVTNWHEAWDALENIDLLKAALPTTLSLHRAMLRTASALMEKHQVRTLQSFRFAVIKDGPDLHYFLNPSALSKLAMWLGEAIFEEEKQGGRKKHLPLVLAVLNERRGIYVVVGIGVVASAAMKKPKKEPKPKKEKKKKSSSKAKAKERTEGVDGEDEAEEVEDEGEELADESEESEDDDDDDDDDDEIVQDHGTAKNKFGIAFQDVASSTNARIRIDSFEATVVEVKQEDLIGFFEELSRRVVLGR